MIEAKHEARKQLIGELATALVNAARSLEEYRNLVGKDNGAHLVKERYDNFIVQVHRKMETINSLDEVWAEAGGK